MLNELIVSGRKLELGSVSYMEEDAFISLVLDTQGTVSYANPGYYALTGYDSNDVVNAPLFQQGEEHYTSSLLVALKVSRLTGEKWQGEVFLRKKNNEPLWLDITLLPRFDERGDVFAFILVCFDITHHVTIRERLHYRAHNDAFTNTLNRQGYYIRSRKKFRAAQASGSETVVAILDLDNFKTINDELGHASGDEVLRHFTSRVKQCIGDATLLGRLGGDEFALTFIDGVDEHDGELLLQHIIEQTRRPMYLHTIRHQVELSVSIGVASYPKHGTHFASILKAADTALYKVKALGGNDFINYQIVSTADPHSIVGSV